MEPEVHIIEKYFQTMLKCFTMTNIKCKGNKEIDLLAINPRTGNKFHVESRVGTSPSFKIRLHDTYTKKGIAHKIGIDYFAKEKFDHPLVKEKIKEIFGNINYVKILVVWDVQDEALVEEAKKIFDIEIWFIIEMIYDLMEKGKIRGSRDDILRTVELMGLFEKNKKKIFRKTVKIFASGARKALKTLKEAEAER